jgi:hypothetical protein
MEPVENLDNEYRDVSEAARIFGFPFDLQIARDLLEDYGYHGVPDSNRRSVVPDLIFALANALSCSVPVHFLTIGQFVVIQFTAFLDERDTHIPQPVCLQAVACLPGGDPQRFRLSRVRGIASQIPLD